MIKKKIIVKYLQFKLKISNFFDKLKRVIKGKTKYLVNIKYHILNNLPYYKAPGIFILKTIMYGLIIFGMSGAIWGYKLGVLIASISGYILYETIILEDIPETIVRVGNSINGGKK